MYNCLIIDDDAYLRPLLQRQLKDILGESWCVYAPPNGPDVNHLLTILQFDVIFLDGQLWDATSWEDFAPAIKTSLGEHGVVCFTSNRDKMHRDPKLTEWFGTRLVLHRKIDVHLFEERVRTQILPLLVAA